MQRLAMPTAAKSFRRPVARLLRLSLLAVVALGQLTLGSTILDENLEELDNVVAASVATPADQNASRARHESASKPSGRLLLPGTGVAAIAHQAGAFTARGHRLPNGLCAPLRR